MMKFYGRNNCKIPLDLVIGKNEKIMRQIHLRKHVGGVSLKTTKSCVKME